MADIPVGFAEVSIEFKRSGYPRSSFVTHGIRAPATGMDENAMAAAVKTAFMDTTSLNRWLDATVTASQFVVRVGHELTDPTVGLATNSTVGGSGHNSPPVNVAVLLMKRTSRGGRKGRGRMYMPWWVDESIVDPVGTINSPWTTNLQGAATAYLALLLAAGIPMQLMHRGPTASTDTPNQVTSLVLSPIVATQRKRLNR